MQTHFFIKMKKYFLIVLIFSMTFVANQSKAWMLVCYDVQTYSGTVHHCTTLYGNCANYNWKPGVTCDDFSAYPVHLMYSNSDVTIQQIESNGVSGLEYLDNLIGQVYTIADLSQHPDATFLQTDARYSVEVLSCDAGTHAMVLQFTPVDETLLNLSDGRLAAANSITKKITLKPNSDLGISPNPTNSIFKITIPNTNTYDEVSNITISISSIDGKVLKTLSSQLNLKFNNTIEIQKESLLSGLYFVTVSVNDKKYFSRITITN